MEENKNVDTNDNTVVQEKPRKKGNAALVLGIIGASAGVLALLLVILGFFFGSARSNMMNYYRDDRTGRIEERGSFGNNFFRGCGRR